MSVPDNMNGPVDSDGSPGHHAADGHGHGHGDDPIGHLREVIAHAAHLLPAQGPITVFIHHNTLHAFEELPFHEAVTLGGQVFGCQPYLSEDRYRAELAKGRIRFSDIEEVLVQDLGDRAEERIPGFGSRLHLRLAMLQYPLRTGPTEELVWYVAETEGLQRVSGDASGATRSRLIAETRRWMFRDLRVDLGYDPTRRKGDGNAGGANGNGPSRTGQGLRELLGRFPVAVIETWNEATWERFTLQSLWRVCFDGVADLPPYTDPPKLPIRHRELLLEATGVDADTQANELLIRFCAAYVDQGMAHWPLPRQEDGFYEAFLAVYGQPGGPPDLWIKGLSAELTRLGRDHIGALESIEESLGILGVPREEWEAYLSSTLLALRGWGGMVQQVEERGDRVAHPILPGSLIGFLAVRLILDRFSLADAAADALEYRGPLDGLRDAARARIQLPWPPTIEQRAFQIFQLAQVFGLSPDVLHRLTRDEWATLVREVETFGSIERRRVFQLAYERRLTIQTLDAVALHTPKAKLPASTPRFQVICCIDEREESFRRHLEELAPEVETLGAAGFFAVAMYYRGVAEAHYVPLCPVVVRPSNWVAEEVDDEAARDSKRRARTRKALGRASHRIHQGTRSFALGAIVSGLGGVLASVPLVARILFPRLTAKFRQAVGRMVQAPPRTRLKLERAGDIAPAPDGPGVGYTLDEMIGIGDRLLRDVGLTSNFARVVLLIGHGSNSLNNPHNSAYNCGACGGAAGGPNARALAQILNDPRVRQALANRGLPIPNETIFVGSYHNTCDDSVTFSDLNLVPPSHQEELKGIRSIVDRASERNAHERCRRFMSAPLTLDFEAAKEHVEGRSEDLAQTRPELGHATNALTFVGRRFWSRGLFLDRRAFLTSYDPTQDTPEGAILTRILQAVFPVCSGINLEYYFSHVDNPGFGAGTKLPHNLASLLGVMDGAASDLRTGLPWQMVEIHEPVRSLFLIETTPEAMTSIMDANEGIGRMCRNGWIQLALLHPSSREVFLFRPEDGRFYPYQTRSSVLPRTASSVDWYRGWRDHLEFAEIES